MSINKITFNDLEILHLHKPALKNSYISVKKNREIVLKTPTLSNGFIQKLLFEKEPWIRKQLKRAESNRAPNVNLEDEVLLFGEIFSIDIDEAKELRGYLQRVETSNRENVVKCYERFYKSYAASYVTLRAIHYSNVMDLRYTELKFRKMRSRWGSCSSKGVITFNTELIKIDKKLIDFIVVHELAHLIHMNHSKKFHTLVSHYIPEAKTLDQKLKSIHLSCV